MTKPSIYCAWCHGVFDGDSPLPTTDVHFSGKGLRQTYRLGTGRMCGDCRSDRQLPAAGWLVPLGSVNPTLEEVKAALRKQLEDLEAHG